MADSSTNKLLLIILAVLLPPVAILAHEGLTSRFWISLVLTIFFFIPGLIYTLYVILK